MYKVLVIDANIHSAQETASALTKSGFEVITASSEPGGLKIADEVFLDAVVVKDGSPQLDSHKLCQRIRHLLDLPVILLGNKQETEVYHTAFEAGADWDCYMCLPINYEILAARIKVLLWRYGKAELPHQFDDKG